MGPSLQDQAAAQSCRVRHCIFSAVNSSLICLILILWNSRARYLRLPTAAPRRSGLTIRQAPPPKPPTSNPVYLSVPATPPRSTSPASTEAGPSSALATRPLVRSKLYQGGRLSIASLLSERPRSPSRPDRRAMPKLSTASPSRPRLSTRASTVRDPSPARSTSTYGGGTRRSEAVASAPPSMLGGEVGRSRLWQELRGIQARSRAPTEGGRSRGDPP